MRPVPRGPTLTAEQMASRYRNGQSERVIACVARCSPGLVLARLEEQGIKLRPAPDPLPRLKLSLGEMITLYRDEGASLEDVGIRAGCSPATVRLILTESGVEIRARKGWKGKTEAERRKSAAW